MLKQLHAQGRTQLWLGLLVGLAFGFLLHKGGVTRYDTIIGQLLLRDHTVVKVMLSAMLTGLIGVHLLKSLGVVTLHPKPGSAGATIIGGLLFGVGFGILGYCPGTAAAAIGHGTVDALVGAIGMLLGAGLFAAMYGRLRTGILAKGDFGDLTFPRLLKVNDWVVVIPVAALVGALLWWVNSL